MSGIPPSPAVTRLLVVICIAAASSLAAAAPERAGAAGARVITCHVRADFNLLVTSARNLGCRAAARELRRYRGSISRRFRTPGGFTCRRVSGNRLAGEWRCAHGIRAFRFDFSD